MDTMPKRAGWGAERGVGEWPHGVRVPGVCGAAMERKARAGRGGTNWVRRGVHREGAVRRWR